MYARCKDALYKAVDGKDGRPSLRMRRASCGCDCAIKKNRNSMSVYIKNVNLKIHDLFKFTHSGIEAEISVLAKKKYLK